MESRTRISLSANCGMGCFLLDILLSLFKFDPSDIRRSFESRASGRSTSAETPRKKRTSISRELWEALKTEGIILSEDDYIIIG